MALFRFLFRASRLVVFVALFAGLVGGAASALLVAVIQASLVAGAPLDRLAVQFAVLCALVLGARIASEVLLLRETQRIVFDIRMRVARRVARAPLRQLEEIGPASILAILTDDVLAVSAALPGLLTLGSQVAVVLGCLGYMAWLSVPLLGVVVGLIATGVASYVLPARLATTAFGRVRASFDLLSGRFRALTEGLKELKLHAERRNTFVEKLLGGAAERLQKDTIRGMTIYLVVQNWGQLLFVAAIGSFLFIVPRITSVPIAVASGFTLTVLYLARPLEAVLGWLPMVGRASVALRRIDTLGTSLDGPPEVVPPTPALGYGASPVSIELRNVVYAYDRPGESTTFTVGPLSLQVRPGEIIFLVGGNGSGKTTLAKLLTGLYTPMAGSILVDGQPITAPHGEDYCRYFSATFADSHVFDELVGLRADDDLARSLLATLQLDDKVRIDAGRLSTLSLSRGQYKRLLLLVAWLEDRPVYVFDEWAADQDPAFRDLFYREFLPALATRNKAVVVISHDDRYFHLAHRLIKLADGHVVSADAPPRALAG